MIEHDGTRQLVRYDFFQVTDANVFLDTNQFPGSL